MRSLFLAAALCAASPATAATLALAVAPRITDAATVVDYTPDFGGQFLAFALAPVSDTAGLTPLEFQIDGALNDAAFAPVLTLTGNAGEVLLSGSMASYSIALDGGLSLVFDVTADTLGLFGPQVLAWFDLGLGSDPLAAAFSVEAASVLAPAVSAVPLPASGLLLLGAAGTLLRLRRNRTHPLKFHEVQTADRKATLKPV